MKGTIGVLAVLVQLSAGMGYGAAEIFDDGSHAGEWKPNGGAKVEQVEEQGNAITKVTLPGTAIRSVAQDPKVKNLRTGITLRVKGDGNAHWVPITIRSKNCWGLRYSAMFPVSAKEWKTVTLYWSDFVGPTGGVNAEIGKIGSLPPYAFNQVELGDRWRIAHCNRTIQKYSFFVDEIHWIDTPAPAGKPLPAIPAFASVVDKMKTGQEVLIYCAGDSITAGTCVHQADQNRYGVVLQGLLRKGFKNDKIRVKTIAVGGANSHDIRVWIPRDFTEEQPDLVTLLIGYNDKSGALSAPSYRYAICDYLDRLARFTHGKSTFLLIPTIPGSRERFDTQDDYAEVIRSLAAERKLQSFDLAKWLKSLPAEKFGKIYADTAHPNNDGHRLIAEQLAAFILQKAK